MHICHLQPHCTTTFSFPTSNDSIVFVIYTKYLSCFSLLDSQSFHLPNLKTTIPNKFKIQKKTNKKKELTGICSTKASNSLVILFEKAQRTDSAASRKSGTISTIVAIVFNGDGNLSTSSDR